MLPEHAPAFTFQAEVFYDQFDAQMILHHPQYLVLVERAQQAWVEHVLEAPRFDWENFPDMYLVARRVEIDFLGSVAKPGHVLVDLWCLQLRAAKWKVGFRLRSEDGHAVYAQGHRLNCKVAPETHQPRLWSDRFQECMGALVAR